VRWPFKQGGFFNEVLWHDDFRAAPARRLQGRQSMFLLCFLFSLFSLAHGEELDLSAPFGLRFQLLEPGEMESLPLLQGARAERSLLLKKFEIYTVSFNEPMSAVAARVQKQNGEVRCDCGLFVQIMAQLLTRSMKNAVFLPSADNPPEAIACACEVDLAYLRARDQSAHQVLQSTPLMNKGIWLLPVDNDQYLGLDSDGPRLASEVEWSARIEQGLLCELALGTLSAAEEKYFNGMIRRGLPTHWSVDHFSHEWPDRHRRGLQRILTRVRR
jgi:hypothetical protein